MTEHKLTDDQVKFFMDEGYIVANDVIPQHVLDAVAGELEIEIDKRSKKLYERGEISQLYEDEGFETRLAKISRETPKLALSIWNQVLHGPEIFNLITNEHVVDLAEQIVGPEVIASSVYRLRPKIPNYGYGAVPWHQDSAYMEPYCDAHLILTFWIPLVDADESNGCLYVIPKSHLGGVVSHSADKSGKYLEIDDEALPDTSQAVACPVRRGGVLIMTNRTAHASFKNSTDGVRWSMDLRYQSADLPTNARFTQYEEDKKEAIEAGVPAACYPPEADFLVRSSARPDDVLRTPEQFAKLRENHVPIEVTNRFNVQWKEPEVVDL